MVICYDWESLDMTRRLNLKETNPPLGFCIGKLTL